MNRDAHPGAGQPRLEYVTCLSPAGLHRMAYWEWGDPANDRVLVCAHGLTRTGRDFDVLARRMSDRYRVVCPDVVGRGRSDWLSNPAYYTVPQYVADMMPLLARVQAETLHWFGTSMGGLIGMALAGLQASPIDKLVLNDVGPRLDPLALSRIGQYLGKAPAFASFDEARAYVSTVSASFGEHTDEQWDALTRYAVRQSDGPDGPWVMHYDPAIAEAFAAVDPASMIAAEAALWHVYANIECPILIVRGERSDLLSDDTAQQMLVRNPHARRVDIPGVGHAPTFMTEAQLEIAERFLMERG
ncbi:alpha/beta hydrolase [Pigmentiphaga sp. NML080357]|uniref:alpha/beta fold hydrolase n=1 Tax=Pigmentiphaga sp. NML080357 TaxID=2008675 RepID=UPI000B414198|nr:alpha/beta hydrolase [Pigmentiphaga sp. NML080357]OVZ62146.1 alpha/beta hydrolase [Pigmentiphaga sp. NML080357]